MKKNRKSLIFRYDVLLLVVVLIISVLFLGIFYAHFLSNTIFSINETQNNYGESVTLQVSAAVDQQLKTISNTLSYLLETAFSQEELKTLSQMGQTGRDIFESKVYGLLDALQGVNKSVDTIVFMSETGTLSHGSALSPWGITSYDAQRYWKLSDENNIWVNLPGTNPEFANAKLSVIDDRVKIIATRKVNGENVFLCAVLDTQFFSSQAESAQDIAVLLKDGTVLYNGSSTSQNELLQILDDGKLSGKVRTQNGNLIYHRADTQNNEDLTVVHIYNSSLRASQAGKNGTKVLFIGLLVLSFSIVITRLWSKRLTVPFNLLVDRISAYPGTDFQEQTNYRSPRFSIRESLFYYLVIGTVPSILLLALLSVPLYGSTVANTLQITTSSTFKQVFSDVHRLFLNTESVSKSIVLESQMLEIVQEDAKISNRWLPNGMDCFSTTAEIAIYNKEGLLVFDTDTQVFPDEQIDVNELARYHGWSIQIVDGNQYFQFYIPFREPNSLDFRGYYLCRIDEREVMNLLTSALTGAEDAFLIDSSEIVTHRKTTLIGTSIDENTDLLATSEDNLLFTKQITNTPYKLVFIGDTARLKEEQNAFLLQTLYLCILVIITVFIAAIVISRFMAKVFIRMANRIDALRPDSVLELADEHSMVEEVNRIHEAFYEMTNRVHNLHEEILQASEREQQIENERRKFEIALLQAQINPHFLCNTFENVSYFIRNGESQKATHMLSVLGKMFNFAARENRDVVSLYEELSYAKQYVEIMQMRFPNMFSVEFNIPDICKNLTVPRFIVQPILENAIIHALIPKGKEGKLVVNCEFSNQRLYLFIHDNGQGISQSQMEQILSGLHMRSSGSSIGLYNIHNRLELQYGKPHGLNIISEESEGTTVIITLPRFSPPKGEITSPTDGNEGKKEASC